MDFELRVEDLGRRGAGVGVALRGVGVEGFRF